MDFILWILLLSIGFILLIKGADILVEGASSLAKKWNISPIVIGLTIVSFGTSAPELIVNIIAALEGNTSVSFGNIVGSNIINIFLILGVAALFNPLETNKNTVWREIPFTLLAGIILLILFNDNFYSQSASQLSSIDGLILLLFFLFFIIYAFLISKVEIESKVEIKTLKNTTIIIYIVFGLLALMFGGKLAVENAINIAKYFDVSDRIIGLTLVALGTSLPELFTTVIAAKKGEVDIAVGNVVGSNIFNVFFILGLTSMISPIQFFTAMNYDLLIMILASLFLFFTMFTGNKKILDRWEAIIFLGIYLLYNIYLFY